MSTIHNFSKDSIISISGIYQHALRSEARAADQLQGIGNHDGFLDQKEYVAYLAIVHHQTDAHKNDETWKLFATITKRDSNRLSNHNLLEHIINSAAETVAAGFIILNPAIYAFFAVLAGTIAFSYLQDRYQTAGIPIQTNHRVSDTVFGTIEHLAGEVVSGFGLTNFSANPLTGGLLMTFGNSLAREGLHWVFNRMI